MQIWAGIDCNTFIYYCIDQRLYFKSSLLMTVMNELVVRKGDIEVQGSTAYAAQQPWIFSGTVRQNILFGKEYKKDWFQTVIKACGIHTVSTYFSEEKIAEF